MLRVDAKVKKSPIHGKGLFADQNIKEGQVVWEFDEKVDLEIPEKYIAVLTKDVKDFVDLYGSRSKGIVHLSMDDSRYMNHSREPNVKTGPGRESMYAVRDIKKGEELLCDYREFDDDSREGKEDYV